MEGNVVALSSRLRSFSTLELSQKDAFLKRKLKTSNPQKFFRNLAGEAGRLGYVIDTEIQEKIAQGLAAKDVYMKSPLVGTRKRVKRQIKSYRTLLIGVALAASGVLLALFSLYSLILVGLGELMILFWLQSGRSKDSKSAETTSKIWLFLEGQPPANGSQYAQPIEQRGPPSEFTVYAAWDSEGEKELVQKECEQMATKLDSFI